MPQNFLKLLGEPSSIDREYVLNRAECLLKEKKHKSAFAQEDLQLILKDFK